MSKVCIENAGNQNELWQTDGTVSGTQKLVDLPSLTSAITLYVVKDQLLLRQAIYEPLSPEYPASLTFHGELWRVNTISATLDLVWKGDENQFVAAAPIAWRDKIVFATTNHVRVINPTFTDSVPIADISTYLISSGLATLGDDLYLISNSWRYGVEVFKLSPNALSDPYIVGPDGVGAPPQGRARIYTHYGNIGAALPTTGTVTLTATLPLSLTYLSDSFGVSPTINGTQVVWQVPALGFLEQRDAYLEVGLPDVAVGSRYPVTLTISTSDLSGNPIYTVLRSDVMAARQIMLPMAVR